MSMRYQAGVLTASYFPLKTPNAPTIGAATQASSTSVSVTFTAPTDIGGGAITSYVVVSSPGNIIASGSSSPITVTGLTSGTAYSFRVFANNAFGNSPASASSNVVTLVPAGQEAFTTAGTYSWVAPAGVTSICVVAVGGGGSGAAGVGNPGLPFFGTPSIGGGGGGSLQWQNNIPVTPGNSYTVVVGAGGTGVFSTSNGSAGSPSYFNATSGTNFCNAPGGGAGLLDAATAQTAAGSSNGSGTSGGGRGGGSEFSSGNGGRNGAGGAGGYQAGSSTASFGRAAASFTNGYAGEFGGGGGAAGQGNTTYMSGGGVGILGEGTSGAGGVSGNIVGKGGSGGANGGQSGNNGGAGGAYGGGGGGTLDASNGVVRSGAGGSGAVRIIWGVGRAFPSTNTGNL